MKLQTNQKLSAARDSSVNTCDVGVPVGKWCYAHA
jgi:hypothetical protein